MIRRSRGRRRASSEAFWDTGLGTIDGRRNALEAFPVSLSWLFYCAYNTACCPLLPLSCIVTHCGVAEK